MSSEEEEWVINQIVAKRIRKGKAGATEYLVSWQGYDDDSNSWHTPEELDDLGVAPGLVKSAIANFKPTKAAKPKTKKVKEESPLWLEAQQKHWQATQDTFELEKERAKQKAIQDAIDAQNRAEEEKRAAEVMRKQREEERKLREANLFLLYSKIEGLEEKIKDVNTKVFRPRERTTRRRDNVPSLWDLSLASICNNLELYDGFEEVPVEWKAKMFGWLAIHEALNAEKFSVILDPNQNVLDLTICSSVMKLDYFYCLQKCPNLSKFVLHDSPLITNVAVSILSRHCPNLTYLDLSGSFNLQTLPLELVNLVHLNLTGCTILWTPHDGNFDPVKSSLPWKNLESFQAKQIPQRWFLEFLRLPRIQKIVAFAIARDYESLQWRIKGKEVDPENKEKVELIELFPTPEKKMPLTHLTTQLIPTDIAELLFGPHPPPVEGETPKPHLTFEYEELCIADLEIPRIFEILENQKKLKSFQFSSAHHQKASLTGIPPLPDTLEHLIIDRFAHFNVHLVRDLLTKPNLTNLKTLGLPDVTGTSLMGLLRLFRLPSQLEILDFRGWKVGTNSEFLPVFHEDNFLDWNDITPSSLTLNIHPKLKKLVLQGSDLTDECLRTLVNNRTTPNLELLNITQCKNIQNSFIDHIGRELKSLRVLQCDFNLKEPITEKNSIRVLNVTGTKISFDQIWDCFPSLRAVYFTEFNDFVSPDLINFLSQYCLAEIGFTSTKFMNAKYILDVAQLVGRIKLGNVSEARQEQIENLAGEKEIPNNWVYCPSTVWVEKDHWPIKTRVQ